MQTTTEAFSIPNPSPSSSSSCSSQHDEKQLLPAPTDADLEFADWAQTNGIFAPSLVCLTTEQSVGGRGLFASEDIQSNQVVASIPYQLLFASTDLEYWAADITHQIVNLSKHDPRYEWIQSWKGGGCTTWEDVIQATQRQQTSHLLFENNHNDSSNMDHNKDNHDETAPNGSFTTSSLSDLGRYVRTRLKDRNEIFQAGATKYQLQTQEHVSLISLVSSRACFLGPSWPISQEGTSSQDDHDTTTTTKTMIGVIPLFDMMNHLPNHANIELISTGTAFARMSKGTGNNPGASKKPYDLNERDMLLIATQDIQYGDELFIEYLREGNINNSNNNDEQQARKLVQWGFL